MHKKIVLIFCLLLAIVPLYVFLKDDFDMLAPITSVEDVRNLFPHDVATMHTRTGLVIATARQAVAEIIALAPDKRNYANTVTAYDRAAGALSYYASIVQIVEMTYPQKELRDAAHQDSLKLQSVAVDLFGNNQDLYNVLYAYRDGNYQTEKEQLTTEQKYYFEELMKDFVRSGLNLPQAEQEEVKRLKKELAQLDLEFSTNINNDISTVTIPEAELEGVDPEFVASLKRDEQGNCILRNDTPTFVQIMENCSVESTRKAVWMLNAKKAYPANVSVLEKMIALRDKLAKKLGFVSYAHLEADSGMAKTPENVEQFLKGLEARALKKQQQEVALFGKAPFKPWNYAFSKARYKKEHLNIDEQKIAEYFPVEHTVKELLDIYHHFLGVSFEEIPTKGFWHEDVQLVKVKSAQGDLIGYLLLDLYPRDNKYGHACQSTMIPALKNHNGSLSPAVAVVIANFPKATPTRPALLQRQDVITFFHEFGHALHALLGATHMYQTSGTNVKLDFVEMPSQMLEEWMFDPEILKKVSLHYQTGAPLSNDVITAIQKLRAFDGGDWICRQLAYTWQSLEFFLPGEHKEVRKIIKEIYARLRPHIEWSDENYLECSFGHLAGYGSRYYSYLWAKVFALDLFEHIKHYGLMNQEIGRDYINKVIGRGGSVDPEELIKNFLDREPRSDAFFKSLGLSV